MGKHKKPQSPYGISKGPGRWARAYANALAHPNSKAGRLLHQRVSFAHRLREEHSSIAKEPVQFMQHRWDYNKNEAKLVRGFSTCSLFCAALQAQVDYSHATKTYDDLERLFEEHEDISPLDRVTLKTDVRCQVCGATIKKRRRRAPKPKQEVAQWAEDVRIWVPGLDPEFDAALEAEWAKDES